MLIREGPGGIPEAEIFDDQLLSQFTSLDLDVSARFRLNCNVLEKCYRFRNLAGQILSTVALTHYLDGDLNFVGSFTNDYGATSLGRPQTLWEFDEGDDPSQPTTFVGVYALHGGDDFLNSWEIGQYSEQRSRIASTDNGCTVLRNDINRRGGGGFGARAWSLRT